MLSRDKTFAGKRIGVLMGGLSSERDISLKTGDAVLRSLQNMGYDAVAIDADRQVADRLKHCSVDVAFIALHGPFGEDGSMQGLLEILGIPYTGSGVLASAVAINKVATKKMLLHHGVPTPAFQSFCRGGVSAQDLLPRITVPVPYVVKPAEEGSTIGISAVTEASQAEKALEHAFSYGQEVLIEEFVRGREVTGAVLDGEPLPLVEVVTPGGFYDYQAKYHSKGTTQYIVDPELPALQKKHIQSLAAAAYQSLGCRGAARVDFMLTEAGMPFVLEVNTIPGMTEASLLPKAALHAGISFDQLVERILMGASLDKASEGRTRERQTAV